MHLVFVGSSEDDINKHCSILADKYPKISVVSMGEDVRTQKHLVVIVVVVVV